MFQIENVECFDAEAFVAKMEQAKAYRSEASDKTQNAIENLESLKEQYNNAIAALREVRDNIPGLIGDYYNLEHVFIREWR